MKLNYEVVTDEDQPEIYAMLGELVEAHHDHLIGAEIRIAFYEGWNPDDDGHLTLGKCKIASELDRRLHGCQVIVILNRDAWEHFSERQKRALLDHELCHAEIKLDKDLQPVEAEEGRKVYRTRKHDIEEFRAVVERHGIWKDDLQTFAESVVRAQKKLPFRGAEVEQISDAVERLRPKKGSGVESIEISTGEGDKRRSVKLEAQ